MEYTDSPNVFPPELIALPQWVLWRGQPVVRGGVETITKIPINPQTLRQASSTDPRTWNTYAYSVEALLVALEDWQAEDPESYRGGGLGFVFTPEDLYCGIDLDHVCNQVTGALQPWAAQLVRMFATYTEASPSGTGVHMLGRGTLGQGHKRGSVECYDRGRFFTMTGQHVPGTSTTLADIQQPLVWLVQGAEVLAKALAQDDDRLSRLFVGRWQQTYPSQSEADLAFCRLVVWCGATAEQCDALMRLSGLYRPKWDERHGSQTYGEMTIAKALQGHRAPGAGPYRHRNGTTPEPEAASRWPYRELPETAAGVFPAPCLEGNSWVRTLQHCGAWDDSFTVGCSATPYRPTGQSILGPIFEATVYHKHLLHMMLDGYLCDLVVKRLHVAGLDLHRVKTVAGDYSADDLEAAMFKANAPVQIVAGLQHYACDRRVAIFSPGIAHAEAITALCQARGITAQTIIGATPWDTRQAAYEAVSAGKLQVLSSVMVLTEGFDLPAIDCVVLARATKSKVLFAQALGRGLRLSQETGKVNCLLLDATGATERHNLLSVAELLGLSEATLHEEQSILEAVAAQDEEEEDAATLLTETVQATAVDLVRRAALSWVETPRGAFALSMAGNTFRIRYATPARSQWIVELKRKDAPQYQRLEAGLPLPYAFGVAEDTARSMGLARATAKEAWWRRQRPTLKQLALYQKWGIVVHPQWTQGEVSDALTKVTAEWYWPR